MRKQQHDHAVSETNRTGRRKSVSEGFQYEPYGRVAAAEKAGQGDGDAWRCLHEGLRSDDGTSALRRFRNRDYSPSLGRWVQQDPLGYVDGMSLYEYVRTNPVHTLDPQGLWGDSVHHGETYRWAMELRLPPAAAETIAGANARVDNSLPSLGALGMAATRTGPLPVAGDQSWHFDTNKGKGEDTRLRHFEDMWAAAKRCCGDTGYPDRLTSAPSFAPSPGEIAAKEAATYLGYGLHPYQDMVAHADFGFTVEGKLWSVHNSKSPQKTYGDPAGYPDDPNLDPMGPVTGYSAANYGYVSKSDLMKTAEGHEFVYYKPSAEKKRLRWTEAITKDALSNFLSWVRESGRCACKVFFGIVE